MPVYSEQSRLSEKIGTFAILFISFSLASCDVDIVAITSNFCDAVLTSPGTVVDYAAAAGGGLVMAAGQVSPTFQRFTLAIALTVGAFFVGNLSPPIFPEVFSGNELLFHDLRGILVLALFCVAGLLAILNKTITFKKSADFVGVVPARPRNRRLDRRVGERSARVTEPQAASVNLFEFSQDALIVTNAEGVVLELNREAQTMFGRSRKHMVGQSIEALIPHCELARPKGSNDSPVHHSTVKTLPIERQKLRGVRKNGTTFAIEVNLSPGRSGGSYAVVASIRTVTEPEKTYGELQPCEFARGNAVDITERNQVEQPRHALFASLEHRLTALVKNSVQPVNVSKDKSPTRRSSAQANLSFEFSESRFNDSSNELADDQWTTRWADEEKNARAAAFSLLRVIGDIKKSSTTDDNSLELTSSPTAAKQRIENLCDRLFPTSRIVAN